MNEPPAAKPRFTRRRAVAMAVLLVLVLAVGGFVFGMFDRAPSGAIKATFVGFEMSANGTSSVAVVRLTNLVNKTFQFRRFYNEITFGRFVSRSATGEVVWTPTFVAPSLPTPIPPAPSTGNTVTVRFRTPFSFVILPHSEVTQQVPLPADGRTGRVAVWCLPTTRSLPRFLHFARPLWWKLTRSNLKEFWPECEQEIQCPRRLPDGTIEPPRLVGKEGSKR